MEEEEWEEWEEVYIHTYVLYIYIYIFIYKRYKRSDLYLFVFLIFKRCQIETLVFCLSFRGNLKKTGNHGLNLCMYQFSYKCTYINLVFMTLFVKYELKFFFVTLF